MLRNVLDVLKSVARHFTKVLIVVDALDECSETTRTGLLSAPRLLAKYC
jgi:hypothetical protein